MSRIGKLPIPIPDGRDGEGRRRRRSRSRARRATTQPLLRRDHRRSIERRHVRVVAGATTATTRALHGLTRKLIANSVAGVSTGFTRTLEIIGVGYRAEVKGKALSAQPRLLASDRLSACRRASTAKVDQQVVVTLEGNNRQLLGESGAQIRAPAAARAVQGQGHQVRRRANPPQSRQGGRRGREIARWQRRQKHGGAERRQARVRRRVQGTDSAPAAVRVPQQPAHLRRR